MGAYTTITVPPITGVMPRQGLASTVVKGPSLMKAIRTLDDKYYYKHSKHDKVPLSKGPVHGIWNRRESDLETIFEVAQPSHGDETRESGGASAAVSDTSFTPPKNLKNLKNLVQLDQEGRRRILAPPGVRGDASPIKHKNRFIFEDPEGKKHLIPPPGFRDLFPMKIEKTTYTANEPTFSFQRKDNFEKLEAKYGGISLALMAEKKLAVATPRKMRFSMDPTGYHAIPRSETERPTSLPPPPPTSNRPVAGWSSSFAKNIFDIENDILYNGRLPVSTF
ncbi:hypothetical protein F4825DRAFT_455155 [Nemania diffusa]|nr:hypothetical protein F4825DRAFT_455155 [Nemania diffusa]